MRRVTHRACAGREPRGQALPLVMVFVAMGGLAWVALYHVSHIADARVRLTHVADATAYSGAVAQARSLNLLAYIHRAEIAHQVAMAHLVTYASLVQQAETQSQQRMRRNPQVSLIRRLFGNAAGEAYAQVRAEGDLAPELARAFQAHDDVVHEVLAKAASSTVADMADLRLQLMQRVLYANYPEYAQERGTAASGPLRIALLSDGLSGYIGHYPMGQDHDYQRDMVEQATSRYAFLADRMMTRRNAWVVNESCPTKRHELRRRGRTWLDESGRWAAEDSLSLHALRSNRWIGCYFREYPMGWGSVGRRAAPELSTASNPPHTFSEQKFWRWVQDHTSWDLYEGQDNPMANAYASHTAWRWPSRGLPGYHDLSEDALHRPLRFAVRLQHAISASQDGAANPLRLSIARDPAPGRRAGTIVTVHSAAETYFAAPTSLADQKDERASLFRPYWHARLSPIVPGAKPAPEGAS